jgi:hypothetical protein
MGISMKMPIEFAPVYGGSYSPAEYIRLVRSRDRNIRSLRILPPQFGPSSVGSLREEFRIPVFQLPASSDDPEGAR